MKALGIDLKLIIFQLINFLIIMYLIQRFAAKPLSKMLHERANKIKESLEAAETAKKEADELELKYQAEIQKNKEEVKEMLEESKRQAKEMQKDLKSKAEADIDTMKQQAAKEIGAEKANILKDVKHDIVSLVSEAVTKVAIKDLSNKDAEALVNESVEKI